ncbi:putative transposase [Dysgonomonadaceae bacterium PH5-43]|nr:putative transposase [Dysgonomonadaceae bacterium PH5-43]
MTTDKFQNKYRIPQARAKWHDYSSGMYFVTVCTKNKECLFGDINNEQMNNTVIGDFLNEQLRNVNQHYPYCEIPIFIVMPNHWHAIVIVNGDKIPYERKLSSIWHTESIDDKLLMRNIANHQGWLSVLIGGVKSAVTKFANKNNIDFVWQPRFYDRIIRDVKEMNRIADYIENNVAVWDLDCYNNLSFV